MTLYELVKQQGGLDIGDNIYDWGNYFDFSDDDCDDYDICMVVMAKEIEVVNVNPNWFSCCKITEYLEKHKDTFTEFMNTFYDDENEFTIPPHMRWQESNKYDGCCVRCIKE